ncbi:SVM family protein [New Jersey aster yellows phytoplasma]|uniref:Effector protein n=1 Tax=New Jersey aster yellows phytoplasma TaxID=270520 RepID=A0ABX4K1Q4_9MOLU|nr:SVM family protein [New Jersey aster yellows phytoplasma]PEH36296.1 effector protein [New Jersey aster yellows phytoplasma]
MFKIKHHLLFLNIFVFFGLGLFLITSNNYIMAMGNKNSNNNEISNDEEYALYVQAEFSIQNELTNFKFNNEKNQNFCINKLVLQKTIQKYNKRKNNHQLSTPYDNRPESFQNNLHSLTENNNNLSGDLQYINLTKNNSNIYSVDKPESYKKNDSKNKGVIIND